MEKGKTYLVENNWCIFKCTCIEITEKCYKIKWENGESAWLRKTDFENIYPSPAQYQILECVE